MLKRHALASILLSAALTTAALMLLARLPDMLGIQPDTVTVTEQAGTYDLAGITDWDQTAVTLPPGSAYYPSFLLTPETANSAVPASTDEFDALRADYLSQRFLLELPDTGEAYALTFRLSGRHAMRVYVNGTLAGETGRVGTTKQDTAVWENNITVSASPVNGKLDILLDSAQFYHARGGANLATLTVQKAAGTVTPRLSEPMKGLIMTGALLCAAILLMSVYLFLSHTKATLYFALACLAMALRECVQSQAWTYFPINGNTAFMLEYLSVALLTVFLSLYLGQYAAGPILRGIQYAAILGSLVYGGMTLLGDSLLYTSQLKYYQGFLVVCIVSGVSGLFWNMRRPTMEQAAALYGIAVFYLAAVSDIAMYRDLFGVTHSNTPISEAAMLVFTAAQTVSLFFMNSRILSKSKEAEQKLTLEKAALEDLNRMKTEFWGNASHEMRTPLTVISVNVQTVAEMLEDRNEAAKDAGATELLVNAQEEIMRLTRMVGGMLTLSFLREKTDKQAVDLTTLLRSSADIFALHLKKQGNLLKTDIADGLEVFGNADLLAQVVANLLQNAAAYTRQGAITLRAQKIGREILVKVEDTGSGISAELLPHVFERGVSTGGTGFGLYLCKTVVESLGGRIWMESVPGAGTLAAFALPIYEGQFGGEAHA